MNSFFEVFFSSERGEIKGCVMQILRFIVRMFTTFLSCSYHNLPNIENTLYPEDC